MGVIRTLTRVAVACLAGLVAAPMAPAALPPLIPRAVLFGNPARTSPKLSPDGKHLAWLAPDRRHVMQVWVKPVGKGDATPITRDPKRGIRRFLWAPDSGSVLYFQDTDGDENWRLYGVKLAGGAAKAYTPAGVQADVIACEPTHPHDLLITMNLRDPQVMDVHRLNLMTGAMTLDTRNPGDVNSFHADTHFQVRAAMVNLPSGGKLLRIRRTPRDAWLPLLALDSDDVLEFIAFTGDGHGVILRSTQRSDTARILVRDLRSGDTRVMAEDPGIDAGDVLLHPIDHHVQAVLFEPDRRHWRILDPAIQRDMAGIAKLAPGDVFIEQRDSQDALWVVAVVRDDASTRHYLWDRRQGKGTLLFAEQPRFDALAMAKTVPVTIPARDGLTLHGYLTLPLGVPAKDLPMVVYVHGGPWLRDSWGFLPDTQFFANRGYACLQVNYRGSTGYGKKFLNAGNRQWGLTMQDDLTDSVAWAVHQGIADAKRVGIFGYSYGGYAALAGLATTPELYACGVDVFGPSNLLTLLASTPPHWQTLRAMLAARVGDVDDPGDEPLLRAASPLFKADRIVRPLLIGQGANDVRVKPAESEQIFSAIAKRGGTATYVLYPDEGHAQFRPDNDQDFWARSERFLAEHLGGRYEPLAGTVHPGATAIVRVSP